MLLINKKYFFINKFYSKILNYSYLYFINKNSLKHFSSLDYIKLSSNDLRKLNISKKFFINRNIEIIYINNLNNKLNDLNIKNVDFISFYGYFINNKVKNNIMNYFIFYKNNYKLFIFIIHININIIKYILFYIMFKIIYNLNIIMLNLKKS